MAQEEGEEGGREEGGTAQVLGARNLFVYTETTE